MNRHCNKKNIKSIIFGNGKFQNWFVNNCEKNQTFSWTIKITTSNGIAMTWKTHQAMTNDNQSKNFESLKRYLRTIVCITSLGSHFNCNGKGYKFDEHFTLSPCTSQKTKGTYKPI
jgi:hypothetical protein